MGPRGRRATVVATIVALSMLVAGGVVAATQSSDEAALQPTRHAADRDLDPPLAAMHAALEEAIVELFDMFAPPARG